MKNILLFLFAISISTLLQAKERELDPFAKELVFKAISDHVYKEESGKIRSPQNISDFNYHYLSSEKVLVTGTSYSPMDNKIIVYNCDIDVIGRGIIESIYDFEIVNCDLKF